MKINLAKIEAMLATKTEAKSPAPVVSKPLEVVPPPTPTDYTKLELIDGLSAQMARVKKERAILSTSIAPTVDRIYEKLKAESPGIAEEFMKGNVPMPELAELHNKIVGKTEEWTALWDKVRHVEQTGKLPEEVSEQLSTNNEQRSTDADALTAQIRRLDDLIYKTSKKIKASNGIKKPKNSERINLWKTTVAMAEAEREVLRSKRNQKYYENRNTRLENGTAQD
jgi:hypothetical protein